MAKSTYFGWILIVFSCQSPQRISSSLEENFSCEWNQPRTFQLCITESNEGAFPKPITYEIFDKGGNLIRNGKLRSGYVKWAGDTDIELFETPGMMPEGMTKDDLVRIFQIRTGKFITKKDYLDLKKK